MAPVARSPVGAYILDSDVQCEDHRTNFAGPHGLLAREALRELAGDGMLADREVCVC